MISGSRTDLLLKCPGPGCYAHVEEERADGLDAEGQAVHAFVCALAEGPPGRRWSAEMTDEECRHELVRLALQVVPQEHRARCEALDIEALAAYLSGGFVREQGLLYYPRTGVGSRLPRGTRAEAYRSVPTDTQGRPLALPVTPDAVGLADGGRTIVLLEWKGRNPDYDKTRPQVLTQAVAFRAALDSEGLTPPDKALAFVIRLDDDGNPHVWRWDFSRADLDAHADALHDAWEAVVEGRRRMEAGGAPALRAGGHCVSCPARFHCPAWSGPALRAPLDVARVAGAWNRDHLGRVYEAACALESYAQEVKGRIRAEAEQAPVPLPDGKELRAELEVDELDPYIAQETAKNAVHVLAEGTEQERGGVAANFHGALAASVRHVLPVSAVKDAMRAVAPKRKLGAWTDEAMAKIEAAGGVKRKPVVRARRKEKSDGEV